MFIQYDVTVLFQWFHRCCLGYVSSRRPARPGLCCRLWGSGRCGCCLCSVPSVPGAAALSVGETTEFLLWIIPARRWMSGQPFRRWSGSDVEAVRLRTLGLFQLLKARINGWMGGRGEEGGRLVEELKIACAVFFLSGRVFLLCLGSPVFLHNQQILKYTDQA